MNTIPPQGIRAFALFLRKGSNSMWKIVFMMHTRPDEISKPHDLNPAQSQKSPDCANPAESKNMLCCVNPAGPKP